MENLVNTCLDNHQYELLNTLLEDSGVQLTNRRLIRKQMSYHSNYLEFISTYPKHIPYTTNSVDVVMLAQRHIMSITLYFRTVRDYLAVRDLNKVLIEPNKSIKVWSMADIMILIRDEKIDKYHILDMLNYIEEKDISLSELRDVCRYIRSCFNTYEVMTKLILLCPSATQSDIDIIRGAMRDNREEYYTLPVIPLTYIQQNESKIAEFIYDIVERHPALLSRFTLSLKNEEPPAKRPRY